MILDCKTFRMRQEYCRKDKTRRSVSACGQMRLQSWEVARPGRSVLRGQSPLVCPDAKSRRSCPCSLKPGVCRRLNRRDRSPPPNVRSTAAALDPSPGPSDELGDRGLPAPAPAHRVHTTGGRTHGSLKAYSPLFPFGRPYEKQAPLAPAKSAKTREGGSPELARDGWGACLSPPAVRVRARRFSAWGFLAAPWHPRTGGRKQIRGGAGGMAGQGKMVSIQFSSEITIPEKSREIPTWRWLNRRYGTFPGPISRLWC